MTLLLLKARFVCKTARLNSFVFCVLIPRTQIFTNYLVVDDFDMKLVFWIFVAHTKTIKEGN